MSSHATQTTDDHFAVIPVADFPFANDPGSCAHHERFRTLEHRYGDEPEGIVGARWYRTLTREDFDTCEYHDADWRAIAAASVAVFEVAAPGASGRDLACACGGHGLAEAEMWWLYWLFADPIYWRRGSPTS